MTTPPETADENEGTDAIREGVSAHARYEVDRRVKEPESGDPMRRRILAMALEGATRNEIADALVSEFQLPATSRTGVLQRPYILKLAEAYAQEPLNAEREAARVFIIEHRPESVWRTHPRARAVMAYLLEQASVSSVSIEHVMERCLKSIDPRLKVFRYSELDDMIAGKGKGSRVGLAQRFRTDPHSLSAEFLETGAEEAKRLLSVVNSLSTFHAEWIFNDAHRALLVALLDLGEDNARQAAVTWALNEAIPNANVVSFIFINVQKVGGYQAFADLIRPGTENIAPNLKKEAQRLIARYDRQINNARAPEWLSGPTMKGFAAVLLAEPILPIEAISWAIGARFGMTIGRTTVQQYAKWHGGRSVVALELRKEAGRAAYEAAASADLRTLPGYADLSASLRQAIDRVSIERAALVRTFVEDIRQSRASSVSRVTLIPGKSMLRRHRQAITMEDVGTGLQPSLVVDFMLQAPKDSPEDMRKASDEAEQLRKYLIQELARVEKLSARRRGWTGEPISNIVRALVSTEVRPEPIRIIEVRWMRVAGKAKIVPEHRRFQLTEQFMQSVRNPALPEAQE